MGIGKWTGRPGRVVALLVVGAVGGGAAVAVGAVPGSDGVIHACYEVGSDGTTPTASGPNVRIIDPSAGQTCVTVKEHALSWNATGPAGPAGPPGSQGVAGPQGPQGVAGQTVTIAGQTFTLGNGKVLTVGPSPVPPLQAKSGGRPVATMTIGSGSGATSFGVLAWQAISKSAAGTNGSGGSASRTHLSDIQVMKYNDKASPTLFQACSTGKHFPKVTLTVRKANARRPYLTITLTNALVSSYQASDSSSGGGDKPTESLSLNFTKIEYKYSS